MVICAGFPKRFPPAAAFDCAEREHVLRAVLRPEHARLLTACADDALTAGLHDSGADKVTLFSKSAVLHPRNVFGEVMQRFFQIAGAASLLVPLTRFGDKFLDSITQQKFGPVTAQAFVFPLWPS